MRSRHLAYILLLLPLFIARDYTPANELKYVSIVDEALENNTWFAFYNHGEPYADKPPLFLWLMMGARIVAGKHLIWLMGLISLFSAAGIMAIFDKWFYRARIQHDPLTSNMMLGTTLIFLGAAAVVRMDMLMSFFIVLSLYTFYKLYSGIGRGRDRWLLAVWIFLAVFSKGPVGLFVPVLSMVVFLAVKKELRTLGRYLGWRQWSILLGLSALWFILVYLDGGKEYLHNLLFTQTAGRGIDSFHHKEPVYYYLVNIIWIMAPWMLLYIAALWAGLKNKVLKNDTETLSICVIVTTFVMLSAFSSKVEIYLLPVSPFVAYLTSAYIYKLGGNTWVKLGAAVPASLLLLAFPVSFLARKIINYDYQSLVPFHIAFFFLSVGALLSLYYILKSRVSRGVGLLACSIVFTLAVSSFGLPQFNKYLGFKYIADAGKEIADREGISDYAYYNIYRAANMDVYIGNRLNKVGTLAQIDSLARSDSPTMFFIKKKEFARVEGMEEVLEGYHPSFEFYRYRWYVLGGRSRPDIYRYNSEGKGLTDSVEPSY
ncbi:MAG: glycosyl transferase [Rikenellaceae bacterium]|nr:glycosyl transferase [Rikenellaceae bacterium]